MLCENPVSYMSTDLLQGHEKFIEKYMEAAEVRFFKKGDLLFQQGDQLNELYLILKGTVEFYFESEGKQKITSVITRGTLIGMAGLNEYEEHHTARCRTSVIVGAMKKDEIYNWDRDMILTLIKLQTRKIRAAYSQMLSQSFETIDVRILNFLLEAGMNEENQHMIELPTSIEFSKQEIANLVSSTRERVSQVMNSLQRDGLVEIDGKEIRYYVSKIKEALHST